jgi:hypothetical protein
LPDQRCGWPPKQTWPLDRRRADGPQGLVAIGRCSAIGRDLSAVRPAFAHLRRPIALGSMSVVVGCPSW